jgi:hypothetical protein
MPKIGFKHGLRATTAKKRASAKQTDEARPMPEKITS